MSFYNRFFTLHVCNQPVANSVAIVEGWRAMLAVLMVKVPAYLQHLYVHVPLCNPWPMSQHSDKHAISRPAIATATYQALVLG